VCRKATGRTGSGRPARGRDLSGAFDADALRRAAAAAAGEPCFGPDPFAPGLDALLASLRREATLTDAGREATRIELVRLLHNRLEVERWHREHAALAREPIERPVFLMGLPRSGTTFLHHLFDHDPCFRLLRCWEALRPCPPPAVRPGTVEERVAEARRFLGEWKSDVVHFDALHLMDPDGPDECTALLSQVFAQAGFLNYLEVPSYFDWLLAHADFAAVYRHHARVLQLLQWRAAPRRWVLKYPNHLLAMHEIARLHPEATFVVTHRDPVRTLASLCDLTFEYRGARHARGDRREIGRQLWPFVLRHVERLLAFVDRGGAPLRVVDVDYYRLVADPLACVREVYAALGLPMPEAVRRTLVAWAERNPKGRRGEHRYRLEEYGLDAEEVDAGFAAYRARYAIPHERDPG
jgi:hypothetical protein